MNTALLHDSLTHMTLLCTNTEQILWLTSVRWKMQNGNSLEMRGQRCSVVSRNIVLRHFSRGGPLGVALQDVTTRLAHSWFICKGSSFIEAVVAAVKKCLRGQASCGLLL